MVEQKPLKPQKFSHLKVLPYTVICTLRLYRTEGNFGGGKIWRIHYKNTFGEIKFGEFPILRSSSKNIYNIAAYACFFKSHFPVFLGEITKGSCNAMLCSSFANFITSELESKLNRATTCRHVVLYSSP